MDNYDDGEAHADGDIKPKDVDWPEVAKLQAYYDGVLVLPEGAERSMAMAQLLIEMYGDDAVVL